MPRKNQRKVIGLAACAGLAAVFCLGYIWWIHPGSPARDDVLSLIPANAQALLFADVSEMRGAPFFADILAWAPKTNADLEYRQFLLDTGFDYENDLDRVAVALVKQGAQQIFFAVANGRFDQKKIKAYATKSGTAQKQGGVEIFSVPIAGSSQRISFTFLRRGRIAFTNAKDIGPFLKMPTEADSADWRTRFERVAGSPLFAVIRSDGLKDAIGTPSTDASFAGRATGRLSSPQLSSLLEQLQWITIAGKPENGELRVVADGECFDDGTARQLADFLNGIVLLAHTGLRNGNARQQIDAATRESYLALLKSVDVSRIDRGDTKSVRLMFDVTPKLLQSTQIPAAVAAPNPIPSTGQSPGKGVVR